jgi:hypothetical protein
MRLDVNEETRRYGNARENVWKSLTGCHKQQNNRNNKLLSCVISADLRPVNRW